MSITVQATKEGELKTACSVGFGIETVEYDGGEILIRGWPSPQLIVKRKPQILEISMEGVDHRVKSLGKDKIMYRFFAEGQFLLRINGCKIFGSVSERLSSEPDNGLMR